MKGLIADEVTNQGAPVMMRRFIDWKDWSILIFDFLAAPQIWMP